MNKYVILAVMAVAIFTLCLWPVSPQAEHRYFKNAPEARAEIIAHGGGQGVQPPNTLPALMMADAMGADILETDVQRTRDGVLILLHDDTLDRTTNLNGAVADMTWQDVSQARADTVSTDALEREIGVPRLDIALAQHPDARWLIEIKPGPERLLAAGELCAEIRRQNMSYQVMVASFDHDTLTTFRKACPDVATSMSADEVTYFVIAAKLGLSRFVPTPALAMQIPQEQSGLNLVHPRILSAAQARNIRVHVWTINDPAEMEKLLDLGVDGIITDYVEVLGRLVR
ncbi:glycerophosphodiester phosphodiesterase [Parvularcula sp. IMCC14364]|uniref:glycerophosphodiester phosphodiesterase n=1 Tax=Parvularcula sp. IMCC14364 TaxID=3067902 RepID=UPI002740C18C|nr:glycerophosphodiester phosphodiesterase [Parvularcula sp. IMCC14364]